MSRTTLYISGINPLSIPALVLEIEIPSTEGEDGCGILVECPMCYLLHNCLSLGRKVTDITQRRFDQV